MTEQMRTAYQAELAASMSAWAAGHHHLAMYHLERAHILGQRSTGRHVYVHWMMLKLGFTLRDWHEVGGQIMRVITAALLSCIWVPKGNTGRANVSAFRSMPIPGDLRNILR